MGKSIYHLPSGTVWRNSLFVPWLLFLLCLVNFGKWISNSETQFRQTNEIIYIYCVQSEREGRRESAGGLARNGPKWFENDSRNLFANTGNWHGTWLVSRLGLGLGLGLRTWPQLAKQTCMCACVDVWMCGYCVTVPIRVPRPWKGATYAHILHSLHHFGDSPGSRDCIMMMPASCWGDN